MPKVTMIPATINPLTHLPSVAARKRRVAGYARVSTDSDEQFTSYEAQVDYYTNYIQSRSDWEFSGIYAEKTLPTLIQPSVSFENGRKWTQISDSFENGRIFAQ